MQRAGSARVTSSPCWTAYTRDSLCRPWSPTPPATRISGFFKFEWYLATTDCVSTAGRLGLRDRGTT